MPIAEWCKCGVSLYPPVRIRVRFPSARGINDGLAYRSSGGLRLTHQRFKVRDLNPIQDVVDRDVRKVRISQFAGLLQGCIDRQTLLKLNRASRPSCANDITGQNQRSYRPGRPKGLKRHLA